jgi:leucine dehydrogenase
MVHYDTTNEALEDALRLGYMMSYKAAITNLPHGGAKAVLIKPKVIKNRDAFFEKFGEFMNELGGRYITAVDSGTSPAEMDIIARKTKFVTCTSNSGSAGDPSPLTAFGVRRGMEAAVKFKLGRDSLEGIHVTLQGVGHVGYALAKDLHRLGARLTIADVNTRSLERCADEFKAKICKPHEIYDINADVFAPNALGAVINRETIKRLNVKIIAGAANNQLSHHQYGHLLAERGILYAPDFLINAGGLIHVAVIYGQGTIEQSTAKIMTIYDMTYEIFEQSAKEGIAPNFIAEKIARDRLYK